MCRGGQEAWQRSPTGAEMRVMAYLALIKGALGLQYFARSPADVFPNSPSAWNAVRRVALEVAELTPALAKGQKSASTLAVSDNSTWIEAAAFDSKTEPGDEVTVVAVANCNNTPSALTLSGLATADGKSYTGVAEVVDQNRNVTVTAGVMRDVLLGYGAVSYRFPPVNWSGGGLVSAHNGILNPSCKHAASVFLASSCLTRVVAARRVRGQRRQPGRRLPPRPSRSAQRCLFPVGQPDLRGRRALAAADRSHGGRWVLRRAVSFVADQRDAV